MAFTGGGGPIGGGPGEGEGGGGEPLVVESKRVVREDELSEQRAQEAEARATGLEARVAELEGKLNAAEQEAAAARERAGTVERRGEMERRLREAGAVDIPTGMLLLDVEAAGEETLDVETAVGSLRESKPFLFRRSGGGRRRASAMSASTGSRAGVDLGSLAEEARESGDRTALLRYLRGRRAV
ncbi:MAG: hypothetical protein ACI89L_001911 [Phycisphaerales bacterium]|jgi:hypothetical protein